MPRSSVAAAVQVGTDVAGYVMEHFPLPHDAPGLQELLRDGVGHGEPRLR
jgi:hypothetical protein